MPAALRFVLAFAVSAAFAGPAAFAEADAPALERGRPAAVGMDPDGLRKIPERMREFVDAGVVSGVVTLVAKDGKIVELDAVGSADREGTANGDRPMTTDTLFAVASMTKPITATALMILVDDGQVALNDPVSKYVPEFKDAALKSGGKPSRPVTLRDLLTHTSGLGGDQQNSGSLEETAKSLAARGLDFEPGSKWQYSPGLSVIGRVIEVASGKPYEDFLATRIFKPLGMKDTTFHPTAEQQARLAKLYKKGDGGGLAPATHWINDVSDPHRSPNPSGGLFSTATDMARFYQMALNGGDYDEQRIVSEKSVAEMTTIKTDELKTGFTDGNGWGLGWCVVRSPQGVTAALSPGSFGHGGAFGTQGWIDPQRKMIFVLMIQRADLGNSDASDLRKTLQDAAVAAVRAER